MEDRDAHAITSSRADFQHCAELGNTCYINSLIAGGEGGIRTHGTVTRTTVFETVPFDHSGTSPRQQNQPLSVGAMATKCEICTEPAPHYVSAPPRSFLTLIAEHVAINIKRNGLARMGSRVQASGLLHVAELIGAAAEVLLKVDGKNVAHTTVKRSAPAALIASDTTAELFDHAFAFSLSFIQGFVGGRQ